MEVLEFAALAGVTFCAATVQAATGFGFAIMAVPFFLLIMGSLAAIQLTAAVNFFISLVLIRQLLQHAPGRLLLHLILGSIAGYPIGFAAFNAADLASVQLIVGLLITMFALVLALKEFQTGRSVQHGYRKAPGEFEEKRFQEFAVGVVSGIMGVALAMPGPVVVLYLLARHAGKLVSRAATLLLFGFSYGAITLTHALWGGMTAHTWLLAAMLTPVVAAGAVVGHVSSRYLSEDRFRTVVLVILMACGLYGIWAAI